MGLSNVFYLERLNRTAIALRKGLKQAPARRVNTEAVRDGAMEFDRLLIGTWIALSGGSSVMSDRMNDVVIVSVALLLMLAAWIAM